jgi:hypothetical protein
MILGMVSGMLPNQGMLSPVIEMTPRKIHFTIRAREEFPFPSVFYDLLMILSVPLI